MEFLVLAIVAIVGGGLLFIGGHEPLTNRTPTARNQLGRVAPAWWCGTGRHHPPHNPRRLF